MYRHKDTRPSWKNDETIQNQRKMVDTYHEYSKPKRNNPDGVKVDPAYIQSDIDVKYSYQTLSVWGLHSAGVFKSKFLFQA